ncbi:hypothetical protein cypCar_00004041 [Cyprinus carpio]|nr:hypothetical protein cypCar_00004041 [Cyprinus carpio]
MANLNWKPFVYGGMASIVAEFGTFPIDLTKTRLQVQGQTHCMEVRYRGMFHALLRIGREEGIRALYSGISPAVLRQASYGTIKIGTYNTLKKLFVSDPEDETMVINVFCGVVSGVLSSSLANPTDVLKIRMQAQGSLLQGSMMSNFISIYQTEGTRGLWRGVIPTAQRAAIVVGVELPVYDITKKHLIHSGLMGDTVFTHFISSFTCGLAGALASNPVDVVRTRMMNQRVLAGLNTTTTRSSCPLSGVNSTPWDCWEPSPPGREELVALPPASEHVLPPRPVALAPVPALLPPSTPAVTIGHLALPGSLALQLCTVSSVTIAFGHLHGVIESTSSMAPPSSNTDVECSPGCAQGYHLPFLVQGHPLDYSTFCTTLDLFVWPSRDSSSSLASIHLSA